MPVLMSAPSVGTGTLSFCELQIKGRGSLDSEVDGSRPLRYVATASREG